MLRVTHWSAVGCCSSYLEMLMSREVWTGAHRALFKKALAAKFEEIVPIHPVFN
jgi:hypothetical protein